jgi:hypothetical protein
MSRQRCVPALDPPSGRCRRLRDAVARSDIYISADIEPAGPIPGRYSMLSFGLAVAATFDGRTFAPREPSQHTFGRELRPVATEFARLWEHGCGARSSRP